MLSVYTGAGIKMLQMLSDAIILTLKFRRTFFTHTHTHNFIHQSMADAE